MGEIQLNLKIDAIKNYLNEVFGKNTELVNVEVLGGDTYQKEDIKGYGYGTPLLITAKINKEVKKLVLGTVRPGQFGHDYMSDRAGILIWNHTAFNKLPRHVKSIDLGYFTKEGRLKSVNNPMEFFQLLEYVEGKEYFHDLNRIGESSRLTELDVVRARVLAEYLAEIHSVKRDDPQLYRRRIRDLIGHGEAIMGLIDSYKGDEDFLEEDELKEIEIKCVEWRWRIRDKGYRLSQVHGDYHPWNILFTDETEFMVLDRSRGEWGEPADDVAAMTINYLFFSLIHHGELRDTYLKLWREFIETYLDKTGDEEIFRVIQPFYAWRGLVVASPIWYPNLEYRIRRMLFNFIHNILDTEYVDYKNIGNYFK